MVGTWGGSPWNAIPWDGPASVAVATGTARTAFASTGRAVAFASTGRPAGIDRSRSAGAPASGPVDRDRSGGIAI